MRTLSTSESNYLLFAVFEAWLPQVQILLLLSTLVENRAEHVNAAEKNDSPAHTALTRLGEAAGGDVFVLARIAGHGTITVTRRYIHPQAAAIKPSIRSIAILGRHKIGHTQEIAEGEETRNPTPSKPLKISCLLVYYGAGRGNRTPKVPSTGGF